MSLRQEQSAFARDFVQLLEFIFLRGCEVTIGEVQRTTDMQKLYLQQGKSKTMDSNHLRKCAADIFIFRDGVLLMDKASLQEFGDYWERLNPKNSWGGNWRTFQDCPHFERRP